MHYSRWSAEGAQDRDRRVVCKAQVIIVWPETRAGKLVQDDDSFMVSRDFQEVGITIGLMVFIILMLFFDICL